MPSLPYSSAHNSLSATICDYGLTQLFTEPRRFNNTLNLFLTGHPSQMVDINTLPSMSDHDKNYCVDINTKLIAHPP